MKPLLLAAAVLLAGLTGCGSSAGPTAAEKPLEGNRGVAGPKGRMPIGNPKPADKAKP